MKRQVVKFFDAHPQVTAAFAVDNMLARLAYAALNETGRRVPETIALVSFDDPKLPFVPYVRQDIDAIAEKAVELIIEQMEGTVSLSRVTARI